MIIQPRALWMAERIELEWGENEPVAGELRRLHGLNQELYEALEYVMTAHGEQLSDAFERAQAALAKARGEG